MTQRFDFPTLYSNQSKLAQEKIISTEKYKAVSENELIENVKLAYLQYQYVLEKGKLIAALDSIYSNLSKASDARYRTGESTNLEKMTSSVQLKQIQNELEKNNADVKIAKQQLQTLLNTTDDISIAETNLTAKELLLTIENFSANNNPIIGYLQQEVNVSQQEMQVEKSKMLPEIILGYSAQTYKGMQTINGIDRTYTGKDRFSFFQIGIGIPLFPGGYKSKINAAKINREIAATQVELNKTNLNGQLKELEQQYAKLQNELNYYQQQALPQANLIISNSEKSFKSGEVSYAQHLQNLTLANNIRTAYVESLYNFNKAIIAIETLSGNK